MLKSRETNTNANTNQTGTGTAQTRLRQTMPTSRLACILIALVLITAAVIAFLWNSVPDPMPSIINMGVATPAGTLVNKDVTVAIAGVFAQAVLALVFIFAYWLLFFSGASPWVSHSQERGTGFSAKNNQTGNKHRLLRASYIYCAVSAFAIAGMGGFFVGLLMG
jgi:uncharacterized membrane protein